MTKTTAYALSAALLLSAALAPARADEIFTITLNTVPLTTAPGSAAGPFSLAFQLTDGSGAGDANNTATLSNFQFGGGSATACSTGCSFGGASGSASSSIVLTDNSFFNALMQGFTPGNSLSFQVDLTTNVDPGLTPDAFAFSLLDSGGLSIPTSDPGGSDALLVVNLDSAQPAVLTFASDPARLTSSGIAVSLTAPVIGRPGGSSVPEPGGLLWIGAGLAALVLASRNCLRA